MILKSFFSFIYKVTAKIKNKILIEFKELILPLNKRHEQLLNSYQECGFEKNRKLYINILNKTLKRLKYPLYSEGLGMYSEHLVIFACISHKKKLIKNILEIGTYDGKCASILADLFPSATITTVDLSDDDPIFKESYSRGRNVDRFIRKRDLILSKNKNINFIKNNSLKITNAKNFPKQDLIWVDGSHGYPVVASDITNSIRLMKKNGILMCDDIWQTTKKNDQMYVSTAGFETLLAFSKANIIENIFFRKRIGKEFNNQKKFVSFSILNNE